MITLVLVIHILACIFLIILVLIQRGRGGGLVEAFSGVESMFGTKTNVFLTRVTTICASIFFVTCLILAVSSARRSKSLMSRAKSVVVSTPDIDKKSETLPSTAAIPLEASTESALQSKENSSEGAKTQ